MAAEAWLGFAMFSVTDYLFHDARVALVAWTIWALGCRAPEKGAPGLSESVLPVGLPSEVEGHFGTGAQGAGLRPGVPPP